MMKKLFCIIIAIALCCPLIGLAAVELNFVESHGSRFVSDKRVKKKLNAKLWNSNKGLAISCGAKEEINIKSASYGNVWECGLDSTCGTDLIEEKKIQRFLKKSGQLAIPSGILNKHFGDPAPGKLKILKLSYKCVSSERDTGKSDERI